MSRLPSLPKLPKIGQAAPSRQKPKLRKERRNNGRISIQELNEAGAGALRDKVKEVSKPEDRRPAWVKALDFIDVPRNIVGNIIGSIAGVDKSKLSSGTFGMKKVFTSDILRKLGVKNHVARGILGFVGDIATDPLTFYSLGAKTGLAISKALPKMLRGGTQPLRQAAATGRIAPRIAKALGLKAGTAARAAKRTANAAKIGKAAGKYSDLPLDLARGKRVQQFVGRSGEKLAETIKALRKAGKNAEADILVAATAKRAHKVMGKRGGLLTEHMSKVATRPLGKTKRAEEMMRGSRQYIQKHAVKGRTVARLPFAEQGLTLKIGRQAENYSKILDPDVIKGLMNTGGARDLIGKQARNVAKAKAAITAGQEMAKETVPGSVAERTKRAIQASKDAKKVTPGAGYKKVPVRTSDVRRAERELKAMQAAVPKSGPTPRALIQQIAAKKAELKAVEKTVPKVKRFGQATALEQPKGIPMFRGESVMPEKVADIGKKPNIPRIKTVDDVVGMTPEKWIARIRARKRRSHAEIITLKKQIRKLKPGDPTKQTLRTSLQQTRYGTRDDQRLIEKLLTEIKGKRRLEWAADKNKDLLYLTTQQKTAQSYADSFAKIPESLTGQKSVKGKVVQFITNPKNPLDTTRFGKGGILTLDEQDQFLAMIGITGNQADVIRELVPTDDDGITQIFQFFRGEAGRRVIPKAKRAGFDAIHYAEGTQDNWIALDRSIATLVPDLPKGGAAMRVADNLHHTAHVKRGMARMEQKAANTLNVQGRKQAAQAIRQGRKELAGATTKSEILKGRLQSMLTDPNAPGPIRALGEAEFGASTAPRAGAGRLERMGHAIKQAKQKTFGPGASPLHQKEVSLNQQMSSGADAAGYQTGKAWQKAHQPTISKWAHKLNTTDDDAAARIVNLIETRMGQTVNKLHADDPAREAIRLARESGLADDPAVQKAVQDYQKVQAGVRSQRQAAKVGATELDDYFHRIADDKFRKSATAQKQRFPDKPYHEQRAKRVTIVDDAGNPVLDRTLLSSGPDAKRVAAFKKLGYKAVESDISQQQWNDWRKMGAKAHTPGSSLAELDYTGAQFSNDIAKSLATSVTRAERLKAAAGLRDLALETGAKVPDKLVRSVPAFAGLAQPTIPKNSPFYSTLGKQLEGYSFPQPVSDMLTRFFKTTNQPEQMSMVMKASDRLFGYWKGQQLMSPAYTARNIVQNLFGGLMAGTNPIEVAKMSFDKRLREVARAVENGTELTGTITVHGRQIPVEAFVQSGKMYNMFSSGFTSQLMAQELVGKHPGFITKAGKAQAALQRGKVGVDKVFLAWHKANNSIETNMRLATWMQFMNQGLTPRQSAMRTIMAMPDLSDISLWERKYAARLFPWYRWMRRNGSLQLMHYLPNTPAWFASQGKLRRALQDSLVEKPVREDLRPEWMQESLATQISGNEEDGQVWLLASWLPFQELGRLAAGTIDIGEAARMGLESMRPELKFGAEMAVGSDIFRRRPIEPLTIADMATKGYKAFAGKMGTPLDNLLAIRPIKESFRSAEQRGGAVPKIRRALLGGAIQQVSRQRGLGSEYKRLTELIKDLRARINYARQLGDKTEIETLQRQWVAAIKRMHELGLPGVAKSSQQMLETAGVQAGQPAFGDR